MTKSVVSLKFVLAVTLVTTATSAHAQFDHLKCYKVKDPTKLDAVANVIPADAPPFLTDSGCKIKVRGKKLCIAAAAEVPDPPVSLIEFPTQQIENAFLCYKAKCPTGTTPPVAISDAFGTRTLSGLRNAEICTPTVLGDPPPFTCGDQTILTCGMGSCPAGQTCALNLQGLACACGAP